MSKVNVEALSKQVQSLRDKVAHQDREIRALKDILNVHQNWNSVVKDWIGKGVEMYTTAGPASGILLWADRYNVGIQNAKKQLVVFNKGHIVSIRQVD